MFLDRLHGYQRPYSPHGSGKDPFDGDVFIKDGIIQEVGSISHDCDNEIDASGLILSPGFILSGL